MVKLANESDVVNFRTFSAFRHRRAIRSYENAMECGSYWLAACIAADNRLGDDKIQYAAEKEHESAIRERRVH